MWYLGGHGQPSCTHLTYPEPTDTHNRASKHHGRGGGDPVHGRQTHSRQTRPGHRRLEVGTASGHQGYRDSVPV